MACVPLILIARRTVEAFLFVKWHLNSKRLCVPLSMCTRVCMCASHWISLFQSAGRSFTTLASTAYTVKAHTQCARISVIFLIRRNWLYVCHLIGVTCSCLKPHKTHVLSKVTRGIWESPIRVKFGYVEQSRFALVRHSNAYF